MKNTFVCIKSQKGVTYGCEYTLIAVAALATLATPGTALSDYFTTIADNLK